MPSTDRYGHPLTTTSEPAAHAYRDGIDRLLAGRSDATVPLATAIRRDPGLAVAHAALAIALPGASHAAALAIDTASRRTQARGVTRRERQHVDVLAAAVTSASITIELAREHLAEFPADAPVLLVTVRALHHAGLDTEARELLERAVRYLPAETPSLTQLRRAVPGTDPGRPAP